MKGTRTTMAIIRAKIANEYYGLDFTKDFFTLDGEELSKLERVKEVIGYDRRNNLGRSKLRQCWYYLQWGWKKYQQLEKGAQ